MTRQRGPRFSYDDQGYDPALDRCPMTGQIRRLWAFMRDGQWRTLHRIALAIGYLESSVSANLRNLRKQKYGGFTVNKRIGKNGFGWWWEYQMEPDRQLELYLPPRGGE